MFIGFSRDIKDHGPQSKGLVVMLWCVGVWVCLPLSRFRYTKGPKGHYQPNHYQPNHYQPNHYQPAIPYICML
jgi:hypothetical protein